jgi:hypothetical protein
MTRGMTSYRRFVAEPAVSTHAGNLGTSAERLAHEDALSGSARLARTIRRAGLTIAPPRVRPLLTFEEQLAMVEAGKARVVDKPDIRPKAPEMTLGGVADWGAFG